MKYKLYVKVILVLVSIFSTAYASAQNPSKYIREGNDLYENKKFNEAETSYLKALETDSTDIRGLFNRADALYQQENYSEAGQIFNKLTNKALSENDQASIWHNLGNTMLKSKKYKEAAQAYKNALRKDPADMDTKYNLSYALEKLKEQQKKQQNKNKDQNNKKQDKQKEKQKDKQDKQKNKKKQQQDKKEQDKKQKQNKQDKKEKGDQKKQKQQSQPRKISKQDAKRMLQALKNSEKNTLKKLKKKKAKGQEVETEKDW